MVEILRFRKEIEAENTYLHTGICLVAVLESLLYHFSVNVSKFSKFLNMNTFEVFEIFILICVAYTFFPERNCW